MTSGLRQVIEHLEQARGLTDGQLLARFVSTRDEASFTTLVRRHGPMVLGVCRRVLRNVHDAEDAFQATFLVLARKASSVVKRESVGCWLHGVAYHTALRAGAAIARRQAREKQVENMPHPEVAPPAESDWLPLLDRELNRLPEKYRAVLVLCELEGRTRKEAARLLNIHEGTLSSRLAAGRRMLARRLARSGLILSASVVSAQVAAQLVSSTARAATGQAMAVSMTAVTLTNEVMKAMLLRKLRLVVGGVLVMVALGVVGLGYQVGNNPAVAQTTSPNELEALRRENELLKLNLLVVLEKVRTQETELRELRPKAGSSGKGTTSGSDRSGTSGATSSIGGRTGGFQGGTGFSGGSGFTGGGGFGTPGFPSMGGFGQGIGGTARSAPRGTGEGTSDPIKDAESAVKALREAKDNDGKRKATEALEKAIKKLRETTK